jgi:1-pyrroline-5-carboxylate dehydrogenase
MSRSPLKQLFLPNLLGRIHSLKIVQPYSLGLPSSYRGNIDIRSWQQRCWARAKTYGKQKLTLLQRHVIFLGIWNDHRSQPCSTDIRLYIDLTFNVPWRCSPNSRLFIHLEWYVHSADVFRDLLGLISNTWLTIHPQWNRLEYRPLEGFVYAIAPFNFTALGATLACGPLLMGNVVLWKPSLSALHSAWLLYQILLEAGLPKDVLQFIPGDAEIITSTVLDSPDFAGLNFTGSTDVFKSLTAKIGVATGEGKFLNYPRIVGETGGKNFHLIHKSAEIENAVNCTIRSAFEFQGQKCSAASRVYVSESIWPEFKENLLKKMKSVKVGNPENPENFINAVIHEQAFDRLASVIEKAKSDQSLTILAGGEASKDVGFYVHPTIIQTSDPSHEIMKTEFFGPLFAIYVYPETEWETIPNLIDKTARYALTGSVFAQDSEAIRFAQDGLRHAAGNFYINTKSTGSVVGQQPFGGMRGSGTNDKVGSVNALSRFTSVRSIKEDFEGTKDFMYPSNEL